MHFIFYIFLLTLLSSAISTPPQPNPALLAISPPTRHLPLHLRNITHNSCCVSPGLTFDPCTTLVPCAYGRYCVTPDSLHPCPPGLVCICYPTHIILCQDPAHCPLGETCAYRPQDHHPFCVSINVVEVDPSYLIVRGGCVPCSSRPPPTSPPPTTKPPTTKPPTTRPPTTRPPTTRPPTTGPPTTGPPTTKPPTTRPPTTRPPTKPPTVAPPTRPTAAQPSKRPSPPPLKSRPPSPRPSPPSPPKRPSHRPSIAVVPPSHRPSPRPTKTTPTTPSPKPKNCLAGDPCSATSPCCGYRKCMRRDRLKEECNGHSDCLCLGSRVCVCNDQCTDGEVCAGAPGKSYCFSPRLIESLSWSTTLPCVGPVVSPEVGGNTRPPTTTAPSQKIPGLTGENCRTDSNCRLPRKCITGGGESCIVGQVLCDTDPTPCKSSDRTCYCYNLRTCNCNNDCRDTEICTATTRGRVCVSRTLQSQSDFLQSIECHRTDDDGRPIVIVNEPEPEPPAAFSGTPRPTPSPVRIPGETPEAVGQDVGGAGDAVCIDIRALNAFHAHELVFENHRLARVLCDMNDSCATPGHIVVFRENAMMMKTYCDTVGCVNKIMHVNSPRLQRRLRVPSKTDGLEFTALAAKYETKTEEIVLATAIRVGL